MDAASDDGVLWALFAARIASVSLLTAAVLVTRPDLAAARPHVPAIGAIGALDLTANGLFAVAATEGLVSVASVCSSLYPVVTIALARTVLSERVRPSQQVGVALVMGGVVGIAAG
jgi:drug/metabolite transporter (DMT)-like permease